MTTMTKITWQDIMSPDVKWELEYVDRKQFFYYTSPTPGFEGTLMLEFVDDNAALTEDWEYIIWAAYTTPDYVARWDRPNGWDWD